MNRNCGHNYRECGLDNIWLENGFTIEDTPYGKGVSIEDIPGLHRCIGSLLVDKPEPLTGPEFRFLRRELDLSQRMLGEILQMGEKSVRNWERRPRVPGPCDRLIRHMYQESIDPTASLRGLFDRLRTLDREWHEELRLASNEGTWKARA